MKHKIKVYGVNWRHPRRLVLWYVSCTCDWEPRTLWLWPDGERRWGRPTWDTAFALGVAHQKNVKEACECEA